MTAPKVALITGITGQDGAYLAQNLLSRGYVVHGIKRRSSQFNSKRVDHLFRDEHMEGVRFFLHHGDVTDSMSMLRILQQVQPDEVYNLAAQSHVLVSFESPEYTANADALGALRILEAIRILGLTKKTRFYQASTSEMFGNSPAPQSETTTLVPRSPYGVAKLFAHAITNNYREAYDMYAVSGILFNHESPLRGETFVTRKITRAVAAIAESQQETLFLGNLDARRDWGHAGEYVEGMRLMLTRPTPSDYVLATGVTTTVRDFTRLAFAAAGIKLHFAGKGVDEVGKCQRTGKTMVRIDGRYHRPAEVNHLEGNATKAQRELGWKAKIDVDKLCAEMVAADLYRIRQRIGKIPKELPAVEEAAHHAGGFLGWAESHASVLPRSA
jgi:GDPmannose 4,6-dehydratase